MRLYIYQGLDNDKIPLDATHVIVDDSITVIKGKTFSKCKHLVTVIMGDNIKIIEDYALCGCRALRFLRLSKTLELIGYQAFRDCESLEALFLSSTLKTIEDREFSRCESLRLLILPNGINLSNIGSDIIGLTDIVQIAKNVGVAYDNGDYFVRELGYIDVSDESNRRVNEWLLHHMDKAPFHKVRFSSSITTKNIND